MDEEFTPETEEAEDKAKDEKSISADLIRGHINTIILRALYDGDKYGYEIIAEIERKSHGQYSLKQPSLYSALKRLEKDGYVTSYWGGSVAGGRRKYFSLTDEGKEISETNQSEWEYSRTVIDSLISDKAFDFNNPAPTAVNMRVLRSSTSRVPTREGEFDELEYEPVFDDSLDRSRLSEEFEEKNAALESERKQFEEEKLRFEEEMKARNEAIQSEREWRERELSERERILSEQREQIETLKNEQVLEATRAAEDAQLEERRRLFEEEEQRRRLAIEEEEAVRKAEYEAEEQERRHVLEQEENARRAALALEEDERRRAFEEETARSREYIATNEELIRTRTQELNEREAFYNEERARFAETLRQRDEQLESERRAHAQALSEQEERILREQEVLFRERAQNLIHQNYLDLVNGSAQSPLDNESYNYYAETVEDKPQPAESSAPVEEREYRPVVQRIYAGTVAGDHTRSDAPVKARSVDGIDFRDLESRAAHDGIRITTTGSNSNYRKKEPEQTAELVHKGKALFFSAIVVFFFCVALGAIVYAVKNKYQISLFIPWFIWGAGLALLLATSLAFVNNFGSRAIRRKSRAIINAIVAYSLCVIITVIVALAVNIDFTSASDLASFITIPIIFFFGIVIFGICYYILTRPKKK